MCNSVLFSICTELCNQPHNQFCIFITPKRKTIPFTCHPLIPLPWGTTILLSIDLPVLDNSCKWNQTMWGSFVLPSFIYHIFKVRPCVLCQDFLPFNDQIIFHCMFVHILFFRSLVGGHWGGFCLGCQE